MVVAQTGTKSLSYPSTAFNGGLYIHDSFTTEEPPHMNTTEVLALFEANKNDRGIENWEKLGGY